jgi:UbiD family decarboxylase
MMNLREFVNLLEEKKLLVHIKKEVDVKFEISTVMKLLDGKPLLFENVTGHNMPVVANICSTRELVALGLGVEQNEIIPTLISAIEEPSEPEPMENAIADYNKLGPNLDKLPILTYYPFDGGPYMASAIVIANDDELGPNASYHRMMKISNDKLTMRILPRDLNKYLERGLTKFAICVGNAIPVLLGAALSISPDTNELAIANALRKTALIEVDGFSVPESEIIIIAELVPGEEHDEGPFLDLTETPDIVRKQRVFRINEIYTRDDSLFHGLLPGGLEHKTLMGMPREPTIYQEVSKVCEVQDIYVTPGGCSWLHGAVSIIKKNTDDGKSAIDAAFRGHKSMKHVYIVDSDIDIHDPDQLEWAMATRFQGDKDLYVYPNEKGSSLDPSSNLETRETTKIGFDLTIPEGRPVEHFKKPPLPMDLDPDEYL